MLVRALKRQLTEGQTLVGALHGLVVQKWTSHVVNGQTVLTAAEAGGSVTFTFERAYTPTELAVMAEEALEWVNTLVDPEHPPLDVPRYHRLHPSSNLPASFFNSSTGRAQCPSPVASSRTCFRAAQARISESNGMPIFWAIWSAVLNPMP